MQNESCLSSSANIVQGSRRHSGNYDTLETTRAKALQGKIQSQSTPSITKSYLETSDINAQPQDFVVSNGQKYRVNRIPRGHIEQSSVSMQSPRLLDGSDLDDNQNDVHWLRGALDKADLIIKRQNDEIRRQSQQIQKLEGALASAIARINNENENGRRKGFPKQLGTRIMILAFPQSKTAMRSRTHHHCHQIILLPLSVKGGDCLRRFR